MLVHPQFNPVALALGPVQIHWYGLTYLVAFALFMVLANARARQTQFAHAGWARRDVEDLLFWGVLGVVLGATFRGLENDVFFKVGLITIIGLSAKNAVLIIEFAKDAHAHGKDLVAAVLEAAHLRFRPILMTSLAFILGVLPLVLASGAGSASQRAIGTGVMGGMITATLLAVLFVPIFFVVVRRIFKGSERQRRRDAHESENLGAAPLSEDQR